MASLRKAINDFCQSCVYDPKSGQGTWRQQVEGCTCTDCPLFPVRPRSATKPTDAGADSDEPEAATLADGEDDDNLAFLEG